jgi:formate hydrogenlyase transcriptional activator
VSYFVEKFAKQMQKNIETIPATVMKGLTAWEWPGNIRERESFVERAGLLTPGKPPDAPVAELRSTNTEPVASVRQEPGPAPGPHSNSRIHTNTVADEYERRQPDEMVRALTASMGRAGGEDGAAARLRIDRTTVLYRMRIFGIYARQYA